MSSHFITARRIRHSDSILGSNSSQQKDRRARNFQAELLPSNEQRAFRQTCWVSNDPTASNSSSQSAQAASTVIDLTESRSSSVEIISPEISIIDLTSDDDLVEQVTNNLSAVELTSRRSSEDGQGNGSTCCICLNKGPQFACVPCGHLCLCESCIPAFEKKFHHCPICKTRYEHLCKIRMV